jgi:hypothetical protein
LVPLLAALACAGVLVVLPGHSGAVVPRQGSLGALPFGHVGDTYEATWPLSGGTPPYKIAYQTGTLLDIGVGAHISTDGTQVDFFGTPTNAGAFSWTGTIVDSKNVLIGQVGVATEIFDKSATIASIVPFNPGNYYNYSG